MDKDLMLRLSQKYDSFYLYDESAIMRAADTLRRDFPQAEFLYSIKANPNPQVLRSILSRGFGADAASLAEVKLAASMGLLPEKIQYSAPGKTERDIAAALPLCTLTADSPAEVRRIQTAAAAAGIKKARTGVRINPGFSFGGG